MDNIKGYVEHIVFRNEENGYTVFNLKNDILDQVFDYGIFF